MHIPDNILRDFETAIEAVSLAFEKAGLSRHIVSGTSIQLVNRAEDKESNGANGRYDFKTDTVKIFFPQINHTDMLYALTHELAHRIWRYYVCKEDKIVWDHTVKAIGKKYPQDIIDLNVRKAAENQRSPLWFWYKLNVNKDLSGYRHYLNTLNYAPSAFPRTYSNTSTDEAWADVVANLILGRSHNRNLMRKSGNLPLGIASKILKHVCTSIMGEAREEPAKVKFDYGSTQIDLPELKTSIDAWVKKYIKPEWVNETDKDIPHVTLLYGLLSNDTGPLRAIGKLFNSPIKLSIGNLNYFDTEESDVLYASVESKELHKIHKMLSRLPNENKYLKYKPHVTIAYLKKGYAKQFKGLNPFKDNITKKGFIHSKPNGVKEFIPTGSRSLILGEIPNKNVI